MLIFPDETIIGADNPPKMIFMGDDEQDRIAVECSFPVGGQILTSVQIENPDTHKKTKAVAAWDTGSTNTCIAEEAAEFLGLKPISDTKARTQENILTCPIVIGNLKIEDMFFERKKLAEIPLKGGTKPSVLIGMDIITLGDFSITRQGMLYTFRFSVSKKYL